MLALAQLHVLYATDSVMHVSTLQRQRLQMCEHQEHHDVLKSYVPLLEPRVLSG